MGQAMMSQQQPFIGPPVRPKAYSRHTRRRNKAKRLVETKQMSHEQWLQTRKQGIGSSDAATACGLNPHMSMLELWMIKTGRMQQGIEDESAGYAPLYWDKQAAYVCVLICGHETRIYKVTRSESVIEHIVRAERHFWKCVEMDIPPAVDASESAGKALQTLYPEKHHY